MNRKKRRHQLKLICEDRCRETAPYNYKSSSNSSTNNHAFFPFNLLRYYTESIFPHSFSLLSLSRSHSRLDSFACSSSRRSTPIPYLSPQAAQMLRQKERTQHNKSEREERRSRKNIMSVPWKRATVKSNLFLSLPFSM